MRGHGNAGRLVTWLATIILVVGCSSGSDPVPIPASPPPGSPSMATSTPVPMLEPSASPTSPLAAGSQAIIEATDIAYETPDPMLQQGLLDVYSPAQAGSWPVVVMFHGSPPFNSKSTWRQQARSLARLGFVVFVPSWGHAVNPSSEYPGYDALRAVDAEAACAVAFAQTHARVYGGNPSTMIVFGHSAGASIGSVIAFARPSPTPGCKGSAKLGPIDALVTWDGDWMASDPAWDTVIAADPRVLDLYTPLKYVAAHRDLTVIMLRSKVAGPYIRYLEDPTARDEFFAAREQSRNLRQQVEAIGALTDGQFDLLELQEFFFSYLKANGNPVSLDVLPGTTHDAMSDEALPVFEAAFRRAATST